MFRFSAATRVFGSRKKILVPGVLLLCMAAFITEAFAAEGSDILFRGTRSNLSKQEKQLIFKELGFKLSPNKKYVIDDTCGEDVSPAVEIIDLNGDGTEEVFVNWGNTCTSGMAGQSVTLFVKDHKGRFIKNLNVPGSYEKLPSKNKGFPDLLIIGPGFCHGVWKWTGVRYEYRCSREEQKGACSEQDIRTLCK